MILTNMVGQSNSIYNMLLWTLLLFIFPLSDFSSPGITAVFANVFISPAPETYRNLHKIGKVRDQCMQGLAFQQFTTFLTAVNCYYYIKKQSKEKCTLCCKYDRYLHKPKPLCSPSYLPLYKPNSISLSSLLAKLAYLSLLFILLLAYTPSNAGKLQSK